MIDLTLTAFLYFLALLFFLIAGFGAFAKTGLSFRDLGFAAVVLTLLIA